MTICAACAHLIVPEGARTRWYLWQCAAKKRDPVFNPVTGQHDLYAPYELCKSINAGDCPLYVPGPNQMRPRANTDGEIAA